MIKEWVNITGYGDRYLLHNSGVVISTRTGKPIHVELNSKGYPRVLLFGPDGKKRALVHRLVAKYFVDNPNNHPVVLHNDDNPLNTNYTNLSWGTQKDNVREIMTKRRGIVGTLNGRAKLSEADVEIIKEALLYGFTVNKIAAYHKVSRSTIYRIKDGKGWNHINGKSAETKIITTAGIAV